MNSAAHDNEHVRSVFGCGLAAGPRALLGVETGAIDPAVLEAAVQERRGRIDRLDADDAVKARLIGVLEAALRVLREDGRSAEQATHPSPPTPPVHPRSQSPQTRVTASQLTPFDRQVLATLVAGGGWNARTRVLIAGLAQRLGVNAATLRKVVIGLAGFMRHQGGAGTFEELSRPDPDRPGGHAELTGRSDDRREIQRTSQRLATGLRIGPTIVLFVLLAVFFGVFLIQVLTAPSPVVRREEARRLEVEAAMTRATLEADTGSLDAVRPADEARAGWAGPKRFDRVPDLGGRDSRDTVLAAARLRTLQGPLQSLATRLRSAPEILTPEEVSVWRDSILALADCWPLLDAGERNDALRNLDEILAVANNPTVRRRLMAVVDGVVVTGSIEPEQIWRRPFRTGWLASIVANEDLPTRIRDEARAMLGPVEPRADPGLFDDRGRTFDRAASEALDDLLPEMVERIGTGRPIRDADAWESWFVAQNELRRDIDQQVAILQAVDALLKANQSFAAEGRSLDLLGRLVLREIDWSTNGPDPDALAEAYASWLRSDEIDDEAVWVLASLLSGPAELDWFTSEFVPDPALGKTERRARLAATLDAWPQGDRLAIQGEERIVDPMLLADLERHHRLIELDLDAAGTPIQRLRAVLAAEQLALATVSLAEGREFAAAQAIESLDAGREGFQRGTTPSTPSNRADRPVDGAWSEKFRAATQNRETRLDLLLSLENRFGDLGPRDAAALAAAAWADPTPEVRRRARAVVLSSFAIGPNVVMALLNSVGRASRSEEASEFVEAITQTTLPSRRDPDFVNQRRLALARLASRLNRDSTFDRPLIEQITDEIVDVLDRRADLRGRPSRFVDLPQPAEAASEAALAGRAIAANYFLAMETTHSIEEIDERWRARVSLTDNDLQRTIAAHLAELDFMEFALQARLPARSRAIGREASRLEAAILASKTGLEQVSRAALAIGALERSQLVAGSTEGMVDE